MCYREVNMKKSLYLMLLGMICSIVLFGCKKSEPKDVVEGVGEAEVQVEVPTVEEVVVEKYWTDAVSIYSNAGVYEIDKNNDGKLRWVGSFPKGMNVVAEMAKGSMADDDYLFTYEMNFSSDKDDAKKTQMAKVKTSVNSNIELYVVAANLVSDTKTGVIISDEANLFSKDQLKTITNVTIPSGSICAIHNIDDDFTDFYCITVYVPEGDAKGLYRKKFVEKDKLSIDERSVTAAMCQDRIKTLKDVSAEVVEAIEFKYDGNTDSGIPSEFFNDRESYVLRGDLLLADPSYLYKKDGNNLTWLATVDSGTYVGSYLDEFEPEKINNKANTNKLKFVEVDYEGQKGWVLKSSILNDDVPGKKSDDVCNVVGVLKEDTPVHTWGHKAAFEKFMLKAGTIVAYTLKSNEDNDQTLQRIYAYEKDVFWKVRPMYVRKGTISYDKGDYDAIILAKTAVEKDSEKQMELIIKLFNLAAEKAKSLEITELIKSMAEEKGITDLYFPRSDVK